jgi:hypothetical protein
MNHKHEDYNSDYTHGGGTSTKTTTTTKHPRRKTPVRAFLTPRRQPPPPRTMATFDSRQLPLPLKPRLSRTFTCPPTDRIMHHHIHLTCRLRHYFPFTPSNVQGQIRRPLPHVGLKTPRGHMEHLLNHWKFMTPRRQRRRETKHNI